MDRNNFKPQKIEIIKSLRNWIKKNLIKLIHFNGLSLLIEFESVDENKMEECTNNNDMEIVTFLDTF